ncbi:MAG: signal recognition particle protein [Oscillospiraceae bacterium]|nr:signal recognition particle protein [Oscillospiraceae bacterium]
MAFESLSEKLTGVFKRLGSKGRLSENDVKDAMREVRIALLEADVSYKVVKDFVARVSERAIGKDVLDGINPAQMVIKVVRDELITQMGSTTEHLNISSNPPTVVMLVGLQGAGKTTNGAKLALLQKSKGKNPLLAACDIYRPAAIKQLETVGAQIGVPVFQMGQEKPLKIAGEALRYAETHGNDIVFLDTAGRLHVDEALMDELKEIKSKLNPDEILFVVDAMTGQDAVNAAKAFDDALGITGVFLTKLDGDARGGAALSVRAVTGKPIKFAGTGEKLDAVEIFHPDRMVSRILGMGDVETLIEKAESAFEEKQAMQMAERLMSNKLTLTDYYDQLQSMKKMGGLGDIAGLLPGVNAKALAGAQLDESLITRTEAIIRSMTPKERNNPNILNASRKKRIADGCGMQVVDVNRLLKQFEQMQTMARQLGGLSKRGGRGGGLLSKFLGN